MPGPDLPLDLSRICPPADAEERDAHVQQDERTTPASGPTGGVASPDWDLVVIGAGPAGTATAAVGLVLVALLGAVVLRGRGRAPFAAAVGIALLDATLLVVSL